MTQLRQSMCHAPVTCRQPFVNKDNLKLIGQAAKVTILLECFQHLKFI